MHGLDIAVGAKTFVREIYGDWFRDPWDWFEIRALVENPLLLNLDEFVRKDRAQGATLRNPASFTLIEVPKNDLAVRPAVIIDPLTRLLYAASVSPQLNRIHANLPQWCFGWRQRETGQGLANNGDEWKAYTRALIGADEDSWGLNADITSFFASIDVGRMLDVLSQELGKNNGLGIISDVIRQHDGLATRSGLPQRSFASAALANTYMRPIDDLLSAFAEEVPGSYVARWVDDINAFASAERLYELHLELESRARQIGLELNGSKSVLSDVASLKTAQQVEGITELLFMELRRGEYGEPDEWVKDERRLLSLQAEVFTEPTHRSASLLKGILNSLRSEGEFRGALAWLERARHMPHAASALGRYLRAAISADAVDGEAVQEQLLEFLASSWAKLDWVAAQLALTIAHTDMTEPYLELLRDWLANSDDPQKIALAGQRLAKVDPTACRDIVRGRLDAISNPLLLRLLALTLLESGDDRRLVRSALGRDPRSALTLQALERTNWSAKSVAADFDDA
jgi:hypothetical protein